MEELLGELFEFPNFPSHSLCFFSSQNRIELLKKIVFAYSGQDVDRSFELILLVLEEGGRAFGESILLFLLAKTYERNQDEDQMIDVPEERHSD